ncbi:phage tail assembly protein, partial [Vibrio anguillarum]
MWKPIEVTLCWPVKDDKDQEIKVLVLKPITRGDHKAVLDEVNAEDERKVFEKFASISCGLTADEVKRLS